MLHRLVASPLARPAASAVRPAAARLPHRLLVPQLLRLRAPPAPAVTLSTRGMATRTERGRDSRLLQLVGVLGGAALIVYALSSMVGGKPAPPSRKPAAAPSAKKEKEPAAAPDAPAAPAAPVASETTPAPAAPAEKEPEPAPAPPAPVVVELKPLSVKYLIVGAGTAAFSALRTISRNDPNGQLLVVGDEPHLPYMRTPLSKELWFSEEADVAQTLEFIDWNGFTKNLMYTTESFYNVLKDGDALPESSAKPNLIVGHKAVGLDPDLRKVVLDNGQVIFYEKLLLATGGVPRQLPAMRTLAPELRAHVTTFRKLDDFRRLDAVARSAEHVAVIGGGYLGSELACGLAVRAKRNANLKVTQIFPEEGNMGLVLPRYLSNWTTNRVREEGVDVLTKTSVTGFEPHKDPATGKQRVLIRFADGGERVVDHVVVSVGLEPDVELAREAGLEIDEVRGGVVANSELEARSNIFVAGDVSSYHDIALGRRRVEHYDHAVISGRAAAENMMGARRAFSHQSMYWSDLGPHVGYEAVGLTDSRLPTVAMWAAAAPTDTPKQAQALGDAARSGDVDALKEASGDHVAPAEAAAAEAAAAELKAAATVATPDAGATPEASDKQAFGKGVVFYLKDKRVVGVLMWNVHNLVPIARRVLRERKTVDDMDELKKMFKLD